MLWGIILEHFSKIMIYQGDEEIWPDPKKDKDNYNDKDKYI